MSPGKKANGDEANPKTPPKRNPFRQEIISKDDAKSLDNPDKLPQYQPDSPRVPPDTPEVFSEVTEVTGLIPEDRPPHPPRIFREKSALDRRESEPWREDRSPRDEVAQETEAGSQAIPRENPFIQDLGDTRWEEVSGIWDKEDGEWPLKEGEEPPHEGVRRGIGPVFGNADVAGEDAEPGDSAVETYAFYHPWHIGGAKYWGIYFRTRKMQARVARFERKLGVGGLHNLIWTEVLEHEMEHYEQEKAIAVAEAFFGVPLLGRPYPGAGLELGFGANYVNGKRPDTRQEVLLLSDQGVGQEVLLVHEALATARQVAWAERQAQKGVAPGSYPELLRDEILLDALPGYRDFEFCRSQGERGRGRAAFLGLQVYLGFFDRSKGRFPSRDSSTDERRTGLRSPGRKAADKAFGSPSRGKEPDFEKGLRTYAGVPLYEITV